MAARPRPVGAGSRVGRRGPPLAGTSELGLFAAVLTGAPAGRAEPLIHSLDASVGAATLSSEGILR